MEDATTSAAAPKFLRQRPETFAAPSMRETGTLRPGPEWYPAWMRYRRREDNYIFWQEKFSMCSIDVAGQCRGLRQRMHGTC